MKEDTVETKITNLVLATKNKNKVIEIKDLLKDTEINVVTVEGNFNPEENGKSFQENAYIKAYEAAKLMCLPALADDSGLEVDALNGMPGIYSSRYAENDKKRIERILYELGNVKSHDRKARFVCAMVIVSPSGEVLNSCTGKCEGLIINELRGENGFGYDPIFYIPELDQTMAQLSLHDKNRVIHRSKALRCMIDWLKSS